YHHRTWAGCCGLPPYARYLDPRKGASAPDRRRVRHHQSREFRGHPDQPLLVPRWRLHADYELPSATDDAATGCRRADVPIGRQDYVLNQFSTGRSAWSTTRTCTGPFADVSFRPSCSSSAVAIFGSPGSMVLRKPDGIPASAASAPKLRLRS